MDHKPKTPSKKKKKKKWNGFFGEAIEAALDRLICLYGKCGGVVQNK